MATAPSPPTMPAFEATQNLAPGATNPWPSRFPPFHPRAWLTNSHLQTVFGNLLPRPNHLPPATSTLVDIPTLPGSRFTSQILCECHWQPEAVRSGRHTALILHGLEGSSRSQYVIGNSNKFWSAGCNVIRMNMRNCGGTERLTPTLYHSGMSGDVDSVMRHFLRAERLESISLIGYSMGGNLVLKLAGELGANAPPELRAIVGVSPAVDLGASADALHLPASRFYERRFVRALVSRFRRKAFLFPSAFDPNRGNGITSIREFDDRITAHYAGFRDAGDYYFRCSAARVLDRIAVPALMLHACDDPFIRMLPETRAILQANPQIQLLETAHGGHCAFLATPHPEAGDDGYWAEETALQFVLQQSGTLA